MTFIIYIFSPFLQNVHLESGSQRYRKLILLQRQKLLASLDASSISTKGNRSNSSFVSLLQRSFPTFTHSLLETYTNDTISAILNHTQRNFQLNRCKARIPIIFPIYFCILFNLEKANLWCFIGNLFFAYADQLVFLAPTTRSLNTNLTVCDNSITTRKN